MTNHLYDGVKVVDGELVLSTEMMGALCGIGPEEARGEFERQAEQRGSRDRFAVPQSWRRGAKELQARLGTTDFTRMIELLRAEAADRDVS